MCFFPLLAVLVAGCATVRAAYYPIDDFPCGWCESVDAQPGPMWHPSQQFAVCKRDRAHGCSEYSPELLGSTPGQMFSNLAGPLGSVADKIMIPAPVAP